MSHPARWRLAVTLVAIVTGPRLLAQSGAVLFEQHCSVCHTIGGAGTDAPDLKDVTARLDRAWILRFILDPEGVTKSGDPYAVELAKKYDGAIMPPPEGLSRAGVDAIITYIEQRSAGAAEPVSVPAALQPTFGPEDVARGRSLYAGDARLAARGPSCFSCHESGTETGIGAGTLGPNLARVAERLNGPTGLSVWLTAPPTPVMRTVYRRSPLAPDEVRALAAFFDDQTRQGAPAGTNRQPALTFLGISLTTTLIGLVVMGIVWRTRLRAVRHPLIASARERPLTTAGQSTTRQGFRSGGLR